MKRQRGHSQADPDHCLPLAYHSVPTISPAGNTNIAPKEMTKHRCLQSGVRDDLPFTASVRSIDIPSCRCGNKLHEVVCARKESLAYPVRLGTLASLNECAHRTEDIDEDLKELAPMLDCVASSTSDCHSPEIIPFLLWFGGENNEE